MDDLKTKAAQLKEHVGDYAKTTAELAKAKATKGASNAAAGVVIGVAALVFGLFLVGFLLQAMAWWLAGLFNSNALGFLAVAAFLLLIIILIFALRKKVIVPLIRNAIVGAVYDKKD